MSSLCLSIVQAGVDEFIRVLSEYGITATPRTRRGKLDIKHEAIPTALPNAMVENC
jgi:hypothetical protein